MRLFILLFILVGLDIYTFQAIRLWGQHWSAASRTVVYGVFWLLAAGSIAYILLAQSGVTESWPRSLTTFVRALVFILYFSKFIVASVLLIDDLRRLLSWGYTAVRPEADIDLGRSRFLSRLALLLGGVPLATLTYGMVRNPYRYRLFRSDVEIENLPEALEGLRIVQISDIHSGSWTRTEPVARAVEMINEQQADLIFFTGDIVNNRAEEMEPFVHLFQQVKARHGVYSVLGNHDYGDYVDWGNAEDKTRNMERLYGIHRRLGWDLLRDENRLLSINGANLAVLGVENWSALARFPRKGDLAAAYRGTESADVKILLSHDPTHWEAQVQPEFPDIDLMLSGHTHGMQFGIEIPGFRWSPASFVYKQWGGLYQAGRQWLYVNRGLGFLGYPGRVGILPEITVLTLRRPRQVIS